MQKIYDEIITSIDRSEKKNAIRTLGTYGEKSIPLLLDINELEIDIDVKNYIMETISQVKKD
jgi:hypothetical protein